jgi:hypothetical protein
MISAATATQPTVAMNPMLSHFADLMAGAYMDDAYGRA